MSSENTNQRQIWLSLGRRMCTLFRLNTGRAWISGLGPKGVQKLTDGSVLIKAARSIAVGFAYPSGDPVNGACDLPGFTKVTITPEMVGHTLPIFTSIEVKADKGRTSPDQANWHEQMTNANAIAGIVRSVEEANTVIDTWHDKFKSRKIL